MSRRLAKLALAFSLLTTSIAPAFAGFAQPPSDRGAPAQMDYAAIERPTPAISDAARRRLRTVLAKRRAKNVRSFAAYVARGSYPHNFATPDRLNVWIDEEGHMCAAATMIFRSGANARP